MRGGEVGGLLSAEPGMVACTPCRVRLRREVALSPDPSGGKWGGACRPFRCSGLLEGNHLPGRLAVEIGGDSTWRASSRATRGGKNTPSRAVADKVTVQRLEATAGSTAAVSRSLHSLRARAHDRGGAP